jgi:hypothetical protein
VDEALEHRTRDADGAFVDVCAERGGGRERRESARPIDGCTPRVDDRAEAATAPSWRKSVTGWNEHAESGARAKETRSE